MRYLILLTIAMLVLGSQAYACCGGASWRQYEEISQSSASYQEAIAAAEQYLQWKGVYGAAQETVVTAQGYGIDGNTYAAERLVAIICMYDNDYNAINNPSTGATMIGSDTGKLGYHALCPISSGCHLNQSAEDAGKAATECGHHECHWDYIQDQIPSSTLDEDNG